MPYVTFNGSQYHYLANMPEGNKEPKQAIIFIHGSGGSSAHWQNQISFLGGDFLAIAVDLPGHGLSGGKLFSSIEEYSEFIDYFSERVIGFPFFLAGHSMGGAVALEYGLNYPEKLAGLILIGTGSRLRVLPAILEAFKNGDIPLNMANYLYRQETPEAFLAAAREEMGKTGPAVFYSDLSACNNFDLTGRLGEINLPALVITGDKDLMTPEKYGKFLADNLKNAAFEKITDAGHMLMLEQPGKVNSSILDFLVKYSK